MAMQSVEVRIRGKTPLLMHRFPMEPIEALEKRTREQQAEVAAYRIDGPGTELYYPGINLQRSFIAAASYSKGKGRATLSKIAAACLMISPERLPLGTKEYDIDSRPVVVPATKGRIVRHRPRLDEWELGFALEYDDVLLTERQVRKIVDDAGDRVGIGDFRPSCKGPFGRFMVSHWEPVA